MADDPKSTPETNPDETKPTPPAPNPAKPNPPKPPDKPKAPRPPIVAVPAVLEAVAKAKKDRPDADPDAIDDVAEKTLAGRDIKTAGDVDEWCWEFLRRLDETLNPKKG